MRIIAKRPILWTTLGALILAIAILYLYDESRQNGLGSCVEVKGVPVAEIRDSLHDFQRMRAGETREHAFTLRNAGRAPLQFQVLEPDCHCLAVRPMKGTVAPGATTKIRVAFNSKGFWGPELKYITVQTNSARSKLHLWVAASVE